MLECLVSVTARPKWCPKSYSLQASRCAVSIVSLLHSCSSSFSVVTSIFALVFLLIVPTLVFLLNVFTFLPKPIYH
jgi:hypothetical protein